jgi:hypothetical protein
VSVEAGQHGSRRGSAPFERVASAWRPAASSGSTATGKPAAAYSGKPSSSRAAVTPSFRPGGTSRWARTSASRSPRPSRRGPLGAVEELSFLVRKESGFGWSRLGAGSRLGDRRTGKAARCFSARHGGAACGRGGETSRATSLEKRVVRDVRAEVVPISSLIGELAGDSVRMVVLQIRRGIPARTAARDAPRCSEQEVIEHRLNAAWLDVYQEATNARLSPSRGRESCSRRPPGTS